jgi:hypothetical protein
MTSKTIVSETKIASIVLSGLSYKICLFYVYVSCMQRRTIEIVKHKKWQGN